MLSKLKSSGQVEVSQQGQCVHRPGGESALGPESREDLGELGLSDGGFPLLSSFPPLRWPSRRWCASGKHNLLHLSHLPSYLLNYATPIADPLISAHCVLNLLEEEASRNFSGAHFIHPWV